MLIREVIHTQDMWGSNENTTENPKKNIKQNSANLKVFNDFQTSEGRWANFGPYYAMFPYSFAQQAIAKHSYSGDRVLDPFAGRGTSVYAAAAMGRYATGVEINPVGALFANTKLFPQGKQKVIKRLFSLKSDARKYINSAAELGEFWQACFHKDVLSFLLCAKKELDWRNDALDAEVMSFILHFLHGDRNKSLSNQMSRVRAMREKYCIRYWREKGLETPPCIDPFAFLGEKITWRYEKGVPYLAKSSVRLGDSCDVLDTLEVDSYDMLITSPPYMGRANYHDDHRLRLWMLGLNSKENHPYKGSFDEKSGYLKMLKIVFKKSAKLLKEHAKIVIRTDVRKETLNATKQAVAEAFPFHLLNCESSPFEKNGLTEKLGNTSKEKGEVDIYLLPKKGKGREKKRGHTKRLFTLSNWSYARLNSLAVEQKRDASELAEEALENYFRISENREKTTQLTPKK